MDIRRLGAAKNELQKAMAAIGAARTEGLLDAEGAAWEREQALEEYRREVRSCAACVGEEDHATGVRWLDSEASW